MPNKTSVEIYIQKQDALKLLSDPATTHLLIQGEIVVNTDNTSTWNVFAYDYPSGAQNAAGSGTCPRPCP